MIKPIFSAAMSATPYRADFYKKLGDDRTQVQDGLNKWLTGLEDVVSVLNKFTGSKEAKW